MAKKDLARLKHMLEAAQICCDFARKKKRKDFETDKMLGFAIVRALEILGEAAANISKPLQTKYPEIQWRAIVGMRNRLIHAYFDIDYDIVWIALTKELPILILQLENVIEDQED
jgi:uncharacterized protein with HEPN domain